MRPCIRQGWLPGPGGFQRIVYFFSVGYLQKSVGDGSSAVGGILTTVGRQVVPNPHNNEAQLQSGGRAIEQETARVPNARLRNLENNTVEP